MQHLACIMDGNRRWARKQHLNIVRGHEKGAEAIQQVIEFCIKNGIKYLSLYTFSLENFNRSDVELSYLFNLIRNESLKKLPQFKKNGIKVRFLGDKSRFPDSIQPAISALEQETCDAQNLNLNFLFCYGAQQEIVRGVKKVIKDIQEQRLSEEELNEKKFLRYLWTADVPEPDLIIRTGGAKRLSNFLLYQAAYSELYFLNCYWPEITQEHLTQALTYFNDCKRNFGS